MQLIKRLNPKIRGWSNFFINIPHSEAFGYCDHRLFWILYRWALRRHAQKGKVWVKEKYFHQDLVPDSKNPNIIRERNWVFGIKTQGYFQLKLAKHVDSKMKTEKYIMEDRFTPYNPKFADKKILFYQSDFKLSLFDRQNGVCRVCDYPMLFDDPLEVHHLIQMDTPERNKKSMMWLIHNYCHDAIHSSKKILSVVEEEPYDG